jgi:hypothetical protein
MVAVLDSNYMAIATQMMLVRTCVTILEVYSNRNNMLDKCSLSPQASIMELQSTKCFSSADCRNKHPSWILGRSISKNCSVPDLRKTGRVASARCRHNHQSWSCETLDALQLLTVAPSIHHVAANTQDALQVLTAVTNINHEAAKSWMLHKCSLLHQAYIVELRIK